MCFKFGDLSLSNEAEIFCFLQQFVWDVLELGEGGRADVVAL